VDKKSIIALETSNERLYTSGGLLLKNISEWNGSLYPEEARGL
jgi:hypothetical protein